jgi:hypothetical protein
MLRRLLTAGCAAGLLAGSAAVLAPASFAAPAKTGSVSVTVTGLPRHPALTLGGPAATFTVTVHNGTGQVQRSIAPVVAIDHCTCSHTPVEMGPAGLLQEFTAGKWRTVQYDLEGTGMDYLAVVQQAPVTLAPGATDRFTYRLAFASTARQPLKLTAGETGILVQVVHEPINWNATYHGILARKDAGIAVRL